MCFKGWLIDYGFFQSIWLCFSRSFNSNTEVYLFLLERKKNVKLNNTCNTLLNILSGVPWSSNYHEGRILFSVFLIRIRILFSIFLIRIRILFSIFLIRIRNLFTIFLIRIRILFSISLIRIRILFSISLIRIRILFSIFLYWPIYCGKQDLRFATLMTTTPYSNLSEIRATCWHFGTRIWTGSKEGSL